MRSRTSPLRRPSLPPDRPAPARSPPLWPAPSLPPRDPLASPPSRRLSFQFATHLRGNTALQSHPPPAQSLGAIPHILPGIPFVLLIRRTSSDWHFPVSGHESPVRKHRLLDLTLSPHTPSIQTYANVCSS